MKKIIHLLYSNVYNMGDLLNKDMIEALFDVVIKRSTKTKCDMIGIGSGLSSVLKSNDDSLFNMANIAKLFKKGPFYIWGTGFINKSDDKDNSFIYKDVKVLSLRGQLTKARVEKILNKKLDIPLGDGGLLAERWIGTVEKKYKVGIIPHFKEQDSPLIKKMSEHYEKSIVINLRNNASEVVKQIAECEFILSSSLHGLIVADSYHIPNCHIMLYNFGDKMLGDGFKFSDYYSSYSLEDEPIFIETESDFPTIDSICDKYKISHQIVENKKDSIFNVFKSML